MAFAEIATPIMEVILMISFIILMVALIVFGIIATLFIGTGGIVVFLIFGDLIIGALLVYKIIKMLIGKR